MSNKLDLLGEILCAELKFVKTILTYQNNQLDRFIWIVELAVFYADKI